MKKESTSFEKVKKGILSLLFQKERYDISTLVKHKLLENKACDFIRSNFDRKKHT